MNEPTVQAGVESTRVSLVAIPDAVISTLSGIYDVMNADSVIDPLAGRAPAGRPFRIEIVGEREGWLDLASGIPIQVQRYEEPAFFRRLFKRTTGLTPGVYRRRFQVPDFLPAAKSSRGRRDSSATAVHHASRLVCATVVRETPSGWRKVMDGAKPDRSPSVRG